MPNYTARNAQQLCGMKPQTDKVGSRAPTMAERAAMRKYCAGFCPVRTEMMPSNNMMLLNRNAKMNASSNAYFWLSSRMAAASRMPKMTQNPMTALRTRGKYTCRSRKRMANSRPDTPYRNIRTGLDHCCQIVESGQNQAKP